MEVQPYSFLTSALVAAGCSTPRSDRLTPGKQPQYPWHRRLGGSRGRPRVVWRRGKFLPYIGVRIPNRRACSGSLYPLGYPGPYVQLQCSIFNVCILPTTHYSGSCPVDKSAQKIFTVLEMQAGSTTRTFRHFYSPSFF